MMWFLCGRMWVLSKYLCDYEPKTFQTELSEIAHSLGTTTKSSRFKRTWIGAGRKCIEK